MIAITTDPDDDDDDEDDYADNDRMILALGG